MIVIIALLSGIGFLIYIFINFLKQLFSVLHGGQE